MVDYVGSTGQVGSTSQVGSNHFGETCRLRRQENIDFVGVVGFRSLADLATGMRSPETRTGSRGLIV